MLNEKTIDKMYSEYMQRFILGMRKSSYEKVLVNQGCIFAVGRILGKSDEEIDNEITQEVLASNLLFEVDLATGKLF